MCSLKWKTKDDERGNDTHWDIVYALQSSLCSVNNLIFDKTRIEQIFIIIIYVLNSCNLSLLFSNMIYTSN